MATYREEFAQWAMLSANLKPLLEELPALERYQIALEAIVAKGRALAARQQELAGELQKTITERRKLQREAGQLREYLVATLRHELGAHNGRLADLGIKPRRLPESGGTSRKRTKSQQKPAA